MDENKSTKELLNEQLRELAIKLSNATDETKRQELLAEIRELTKIYVDLDRNDFEKFDKDRRFNEEIRFKDQELHYRDELERYKISEERKFGWKELAVRAAGIMLQTGTSAMFLLLGLKLEFADNGSICSFTVKELMKRAVLPKVA